jgi:hypothetical protein
MADSSASEATVRRMTSIEEMKAQRFALLQALWESADGDTTKVCTPDRPESTLRLVRVSR